MADLGLLSGLASGLREGLQGYREGQKDVEEKKRIAQEQALKQRLADIQEGEYGAKLYDITGSPDYLNQIMQRQTPSYVDGGEVSNIERAGLIPASMTSQSGGGLLQPMKPKAQREAEQKIALEQGKQPGMEPYYDPTSREVKVRQRALSPLEEADRQSKVAGAKKTSYEAKFGPAQELRKEWQSHPVTKQTDVISQGFRKVNKAAQTGTAASDMSLIFGFMKMQDPNSTVREGEYATAEMARGVPSATLGLYNKILKGERLTPEQRIDFLNRSKDIFSGQLEEQKRIDDQLTMIAGEQGVNPKNVITKYESPETRTQDKIITRKTKDGKTINLRDLGGGKFEVIE